MVDKKNVRLPELKISSALLDKMSKAIFNFNEHSDLKLTRADFQRLAIQSFANTLLAGGYRITFKPI